MVKIGVAAKIAFVVFTIAAIFFAAKFFGLFTIGQTYVNSQPVFLTEENLPAYMESTSLIKDLPEDSKALIIFGDNSYSIENNEVNVGAGENSPDLVVTIPEDYLNKEWSGICSLLREASQNNDLSVKAKTSMSKTELLWKYRKMLKYKECVGL